MTYSDYYRNILNSLQYEYSNCIVEGTNNLIKQIQDYRKFKHLKARIMIVKGLLDSIKFT